MKILTGSLKGREINFRPNSYLRPTGDKVRKAMFDTLQNLVGGAVVLDLFSGTGALGIEALSAGASEAVFVESNRPQAKRISENLKALGLEARGVVLNQDVIGAIQDLNLNKRIFDIVFVDAPYGKGWERRLAAAMASHPVISERSWIVMECPDKGAVPSTIGALLKKKEKIYGDTRVVIYGG